MKRENKNRSGSKSNESGKAQNMDDRRRNHLPGSPAKSNRQTKGHDEGRPEKTGNEKKGSNSV